MRLTDRLIDRIADRVIEKIKADRKAVVERQLSDIQKHLSRLVNATVDRPVHHKINGKQVAAFATQQRGQVSRQI